MFIVDLRNLLSLRIFFQGFNEKPDTAKSVLLTKTELSKEKGDSKFHRRDRVNPELYKIVKISFGNNMA